MKNSFKRALGLILCTAILLTCTVSGWVLPVVALTPEYGDVELTPPAVRPNLLTEQGAEITARIWKPIESLSDSAAATMSFDAGVSGKYWNLSFLETNTTYRLTGRVKGGAPNFFFYPQITQVNSTTGGYMSPKVSEDEWTEFSYTFTTGDKRPTREYDWVWFGNKDGTTTTYFDQLSLVQYDLTDLSISDFTWNDTDSKRIAAPGDVLKDFSVKVTNNGTMDISEDAEFSVDICVDAVNVIATLTHKGGLAAGESVTLTSTPSEKWIATEGDHAVTAFAYGSKYVYEKTQQTEDNQIFYNLYVSDTELTAPEAAAKQGFTELTFSDDFNSVNSIDNDATGKTGYKWYVTRPYGESKQVLDTDYSVENGVLRLHTEETKWAYSIATIDIRKMVGFAFNKGYLEYRIRLPESGDEGWDSGWEEDANNGGVRNPGVWAYPTDTLWASARGERNVDSVEMDWMEYYGTKYNYSFSTTLHERHSEMVTDEETGEQTWTQTWHTTCNDASYDKIGSETEFHTLSCLWDDGYVSTYVDGKLIHTIAYTADDYPSDRTSSAVQQPTVGSMSGMDTQYLPIILGGSEQFQMEVDYVRVWQAPEEATETQVAFSFENDRVSVPMGTRQYLRVVDANGNEVRGLTWQSSDTSVLSAYNDGYICARDVGTAVVLVTDAFGNTATCTVTVDRYMSLIQNGDFEGEPLQLYWHHILWGIAKTGSENTPLAELETSGGNTYMKIPAQSALNSWRFCKYMQLRAGRTYTVSFRYKGDLSFRIYDQNSYIASGAGVRNLSGGSTWQTATYTFTVTDEVANTGNLTSATIGFRNVANAVGYVDDFSVCEVVPAGEIAVEQTTGGTISVNKTTGLTRGETVTVTVTPDSGYILKAGTLTYTTADGVTRRILNNAAAAADEVYGGAGNTFFMTVPAGATTITAEFEPTAQNNYQFGTIATAVRRNNGEVDAIRFLNRLYIDGLNLDGDTLTLKHNGETRTITQIGVLLTRGVQDSLTLEDFDAYKKGDSDQKVWHSLSYKSTWSSIYMLQYTDSYMDFCINMTTSNPNNKNFLLRDYTISGYIQLDNGETIYTTAMNDMLANAMVREAEQF